MKWMDTQDSLAEWSKALAQGASPQGRGFEPHSCHFMNASSWLLVDINEQPLLEHLFPWLLDRFAMGCVAFLFAQFFLIVLGVLLVFQMVKISGQCAKINDRFTSNSFGKHESNASLAQLAEHALRKRMVVGSIPTGGSGLHYCIAGSACDHRANSV